MLNNIVLVDGCFDPLHEGHISYFRAASEFGFPVYCSCQPDRYILEIKKRRPLLTEKGRIEVISSIKYIANAFIAQHNTKSELVRHIPRIYFKGSDWRAKGLPKEETSICLELGISIIFGSENLNSSSKIVDEFLSYKGD
jgi:cytidyltransferase-like protein